MNENLFVPVSSFVTMGITLVLAFAVPVILFIFLTKKKGYSKKPFFIGCAVFTLFALILESACNAVIFAGDRGTAIIQKPILYGLIGGFMAGLFEETGRFIAFKTVLKKNKDDNRTAISYGAGHGGFEAFIILISAAATNLVFSAMINTGNTALLTAGRDAASVAAMEQMFQTLKTSNPAVFLLPIVERIPAIAIHISMSVLVWFAAKDKKLTYLYPAAILIHLLIDAVAAYVTLLKVNTVFIEFIVYAFAALSVLLAVFIWKKQTAKNQAVTSDIVIE